MAIKMGVKYSCIVVDPPWNQRKTGKRLARPKQVSTLDYPVMNFNEIKSINIPEIAAEHSFLWLWATNSKDQQQKKPILVLAFELMEFWGFTYHTILTWNKRTGVCPFSPYQITTEHLLFGCKGKVQFPKESLGKMKTFFEETPKKHSEKPSIIYEHIEKYFPGNKIDMFARRKHSGFDGWGNEYANFK